MAKKIIISGIFLFVCLFEEPFEITNWGYGFFCSFNGESFEWLDREIEWSGVA